MVGAGEGPADRAGRHQARNSSGSSLGIQNISGAEEATRGVQNGGRPPVRELVRATRHRGGREPSAVANHIAERRSHGVPRLVRRVLSLSTARERSAILPVPGGRRMLSDGRAEHGVEPLARSLHRYTASPRPLPSGARSAAAVVPRRLLADGAGSGAIDSPPRRSRQAVSTARASPQTGEVRVGAHTAHSTLGPHGGLDQGDIRGGREEAPEDAGGGPGITLRSGRSLPPRLQAQRREVRGPGAVSAASGTTSSVLPERAPQLHGRAQGLVGEGPAVSPGDGGPPVVADVPPDGGPRRPHLEASHHGGRLHRRFGLRLGRRSAQPGIPRGARLLDGGGAGATYTSRPRSCSQWCASWRHTAERWSTDTYACCATTRRSWRSSTTAHPDQES